MIINKTLANKTVSSAFGELTFNEKGESTDLTKEQQQHLADRVAGFSYVDGRSDEKTKKEATKEEDLKEAESPEKADGKAAAMIKDEDKAAAMIEDEDKANALIADENEKKPKKTTRTRRTTKK